MKSLLPLVGLALLLTGCGRSTRDSIEQLHAPDASMRLHAVKELENRHGDTDQVVAALAAALKDSDAFVRRDAATALGKLGADAKEAAPALTTSATKDPNVQVRKAAAAALKQVDPDAAVRAKIK